MTEPKKSHASEATWPVLEACLLAGLADDPERLAHLVERVEDLAPAESSPLLARVNSWLARFRYEYTIERAPDGGLNPTRSGAPGRQLRWPILAEVVDATAMSNGRARVRLRVPDGSELLVETLADDALTPGAWVGVTGTLIRRVIKAGVAVVAPTPSLASRANDSPPRIT